VVDYRYHDNFKTAPDLEHKDFDYALLKLEKKVNRAEYLTLEIDYQLNNQDILQLYGYNKSSFPPLKNKDALQIGLAKKATRFVKNGDRLYHNISTEPGNSGSPITRLKKMEKNT
jgi:V8-like Glu-specific endopeptidase